MDERRRSSRRTGKLRAECELSSSGKNFSALALDVGFEGLRLSVLTNLAVGSAVQVSLPLPGQSEPIRFEATVVWSRPFTETKEGVRAHAYEVGARFLEISEEDKARIRALLVSG